MDNKLKVVFALIFFVFFAQTIWSQEDRVSKAFKAIHDADELLLQGNIGSAHVSYLTILKDYPTWWLPTARLVVTSLILKLPLETVSAYLDRARNLKPWGSYVDLLLLLMKSEKGQGFEEIRAMDERDLGYSRFLFAKAKTFERKGQIEDAVREYKELLKRDQECVTARWRLALLLLKMGKKEEALNEFELISKQSLLPDRVKLIIKEIKNGNAN